MLLNIVNPTKVIVRRPKRAKPRGDSSWYHRKDEQAFKTDSVLNQSDARK